MPTCRACGTAAADSAEHVIASALGGRRAVRDVLCAACNSELGRTIDAEVAESLKVVRMALGIEGDRGQVATVESVDEKGRRVILEPGLGVRLAEAKPQVTEGDQRTWNILAPSERALTAQVSAILRKQPGATFCVTRAQVRCHPSGPIPYSFDIGGREMLRACVKSALVLAAWRRLPERHLHAAWQYVVDGSETNGLAAGWTTGPRPWTLRSDLGPCPHSVSIAARSDMRAVRFDVRLFGGIAVAGTLAHEVDCGDWGAGYAVDPFTGRTEVADSLAEPIAPQASDEDAPNAVEALKHEFGRIMAVAGERARGRQLDQIIRARWAIDFADVAPGTVPSRAAVASFSRAVAEQAARKLFPYPHAVDDPALLARIERRVNRKP